MQLENREETGGEGMRVGLIHKPLYVCIKLSTNKKKELKTTYHKELRK